MSPIVRYTSSIKSAGSILIIQSPVAEMQPIKSITGGICDPLSYRENKRLRVQNAASMNNVVE